MSFTLQAFIVGEQLYTSSEKMGFIPKLLAPNIILLPVTASIREKFDLPFLKFGHSQESLLKVGELVKRLGDARVVYVEAEFFGGSGGQATAVWDSGRLVFGPVVAEDAINQALRQMEVRAISGTDEFDTLGLGRYRDTEKWIQKNA